MRTQSYIFLNDTSVMTGIQTRVMTCMTGIRTHTLVTLPQECESMPRKTEKYCTKFGVLCVFLSFFSPFFPPRKRTCLDFKAGILFVLAYVVCNLLCCFCVHALCMLFFLPSICLISNSFGSLKKYDF